MCIHLLQTRPVPVLPVLQQLPATFRRTVGLWACEFCDDVSAACRHPRCRAVVEARAARHCT